MSDSPSAHLRKLSQVHKTQHLPGSPGFFEIERTVRQKLDELGNLSFVPTLWGVAMGLVFGFRGCPLFASSGF